MPCASRLLTIVMLMALLHSAPVAGQTAASPPPAGRPAGHFGIGGSGALGMPGAVAAARFSAPLSKKAGFDFDIGRITASSAHGPRRTLAAQFRVHHRGRAEQGNSGYFIFGAMHMKEILRTEVRFPGETIVRIEPVVGTSPQFGYGWDYQASPGTRLGFEVITGGSEKAGPRMFARLFVLWGPPAR
jgi:hypothetical protein